MYKFKSKAAGDLIMLEPNGRQILEIIGKFDAQTAHKGILLPIDMPEAVRSLQSAVQRDEALRSEKLKEAQEQGHPTPRTEGITLRQRAAPFIAMMQRCHQADKEIVWGV